MDAVVAIGPGGDGHGARDPLAMMSVQDVTDTAASTPPQTWLLADVRDFRQSQRDFPRLRVEVLDQDEAATTVCGYPARSYVTKDHRPDPSRVIFNVEALVPVSGRVYKTQVSIGPYDTADPALRDDFVTILTGLRVTTPAAPAPQP